MDNLIIDLDRNQETLTVKLKGRLESATSPQLEEALDLEGIKDLRMDFAGLEYLSSAGLRVLLAVSKTMKKQGTMEISNVNEEVMEVFIITGFAGILTIL